MSSALTANLRAVQYELCRQFDVKSYPTVTMGTAAQYTTIHQFGIDGVDLHVANHENAKPAASIISDIFDFFSIAPVPIPPELSALPGRPPPRHAQPPPATAGNSSAPGRAVAPTAAGGAATLPAGSVPASGVPAVQEQRDSKADDGVARAQQDAKTETAAVARGAQRARADTFGTPPATAADVRDVVSATVQTYHEILEADAELHTQRADFLRFWGLVAAAHPASECRAGAAALLENVPIWWPQGAAELWKPPKDMLEHDVCGSATEAVGVRAVQPYRACAGSGPEFRGYTCGMWMLFHATAAGCARRSCVPRPWRCCACSPACTALTAFLLEACVLCAHGCASAQAAHSHITLGCICKLHTHT